MQKLSITLLAISCILQAFLLIPRGTSYLAACICIITDPGAWNRQGLTDYFDFTKG